MAWRSTNIAGGDQQGRPPWYRRRFALDANTVTWLFVALGMILRLLEYTDNRGLYMDEISLLRNLIGKPIFDFSTRLTENQLAPPGFLVIERLMVRLPISIVWSTRSFRLFAVSPRWCSCVSLPGRISRRVVRRSPSGCSRWTIGPSIRGRDQTVFERYPSGFVRALAREKMFGGRPASSGVSCGLWRCERLVLASSGDCAGRGRELPGRRGRIPPRWEASGVYRRDVQPLGHQFRRLLFCLTPDLEYGPIHLGLVALCLSCRSRPGRSLKPSDSSGSYSTFSTIRPGRDAARSSRFGFLAMGLYTIGSVTLARRWPGGLYLLTAPLLLTIAASALHQYPFHGACCSFSCRHCTCCSVKGPRL